MGIWSQRRRIWKRLQISWRQFDKASLAMLPIHLHFSTDNSQRTQPYRDFSFFLDVPIWRYCLPKSPELFHIQRSFHPRPHLLSPHRLSTLWTDFSLELIDTMLQFCTFLLPRGFYTLGSLFHSEVSVLKIKLTWHCRTLLTSHSFAFHRNRQISRDMH